MNISVPSASKSFEINVWVHNIHFLCFIIFYKTIKEQEELSFISIWVANLHKYKRKYKYNYLFVSHNLYIT